MASEFVSEVRRYLRSIRYHILFISLIFLLSMMSGIMYGALDPTFSEELMSELGEEFGGLTELPPPLIMLSIFGRNAGLSFITLIVGIGFGLVPIAFIAINGFMVGIVVKIAEQEAGIFFVIMAILPHGIIELPMVFLSAAIGLKLGHEVLLLLLTGESHIKEESVKGLRIFSFLVVPLLFISAIIEVYITSTIIWMMNNSLG
ncbi:MAG: stage II sporulation protein M [Halobacteriota archaeon]|nr:stage II sporulation protein M [Halobacteriota archaeon]